MTKIRNKKVGVTIYLREMKVIIREYYEQLYANKFDDLDEMNKFPE